MIHKNIVEKPHDSISQVNNSSIVLPSAPAGNNNSQSTSVYQTANNIENASSNEVVMFDEETQHEPLIPTDDEQQSMVDLIDFDDGNGTITENNSN